MVANHMLPSRAVRQPLTMFHDRARIHVQAGGVATAASRFAGRSTCRKAGPTAATAARAATSSSWRISISATSPHSAGPAREGRPRRFRPRRAHARRFGSGRRATRPRRHPAARRRRTAARRPRAPGRATIVARGGFSGHGNKRFATPTRQTPRFAETSLPGEETSLELRRSCSPTRRSSASRTRASRRCCDASRARSRRSPTTRSRRSLPCSAPSTRPTAGSTRSPTFPA